MKTAELIAALAAQPAARPARAAWGLAAWTAAGAATALAALALWLGFQPLGTVMGAAWFWMKMAYTWTLAGAGLAIVARLATPGRGAGLGPVILFAAVAVMAMASGNEIAHATGAQMPALLFGHSSNNCSLKILALAAPIYAAVVVALRRLAPTRLAQTGAAAGLLAGATAASVYNLNCMETAATFVLIWFTLGIAAAAGLGALLGARLLRW
ncbi:MAG: NrsF family protein [Caulobacteraceae bacterium]